MKKNERGITTINMEVKLYSVPESDRCREIKKFLVENSIEFEEVNPAEDKNAYRELHKLDPEGRIPLIEITRSHSKGAMISPTKDQIRRKFDL